MGRGRPGRVRKKLGPNGELRILQFRIRIGESLGDFAQAGRALPYLQKMSVKTARARHLPSHSRPDFGAKREGAQKSVEAGARLLIIYGICAGAGRLVANQRQGEARGLLAERLLFPALARRGSEGALRPKHHVMIRRLSRASGDENPARNWRQAYENTSWRAQTNRREAEAPPRISHDLPPEVAGLTGATGQ